MKLSVVVSKSQGKQSAKKLSKSRKLRDDDDDENVPRSSPALSLSLEQFFFLCWLYVNHISKIKHISQSINLSSQQYIHFPFTIISRVYTLNYDLTENLLSLARSLPDVSHTELRVIRSDEFERLLLLGENSEFTKPVHEQLKFDKFDSFSLSSFFHIIKYT